MPARSDGLPGSPSTGWFHTQRLRPAFESILDLLDLRRTQSRLASGAAGLLQPSTPLGKQLGRPLNHRLPVRAHPACYFRLAQALRKQTPRAHAEPFQSPEVPAYPCWKSHSSSLTHNATNVTILSGSR